MEYVYTALLLHETGTRIDESNVSAVLEAAGADAVPIRTRALIAALHGVDLDRVRSTAVAEAEVSVGDGPGDGPEAVDADPVSDAGTGTVRLSEDRPPTEGETTANEDPSHGGPTGDGDDERGRR